MLGRKPAVRAFAGMLAWSACAFAGCAPAHAGEIHPRAQALIDRYIEATGGAAALAADTVRHVKGRLHAGGLDGTFERWTVAPGQWLERSRVGTLRLDSGYDGGEGWRTDVTAKQVVPVQGADLDMMRSEAWFASEQWARNDTSCSITYGPASFMKGISLASIDVKPPVGPGKRLWFDTETGLLARISHERDRHIWHEDLSGWKRIAGRQRWTVATMGDSLFPGSFQRERVDSVRAERPVSFSAPGSTLPPVAWLKHAGVARLPFRYRGGSVWVRASVNGSAPSEFILDTGCTSTAIDRVWAEQAGLVFEGSVVTAGVGGYAEGGFTHVRRMRIAGPDGDGVEVREFKAVALELQDVLSSEEWHRMSGLIGHDVLGRFVVQIDFDQRVVTLFDPATWTHDGPGTALPMELHHGIPTIPVTLNGDCVGRFLVDVGNATVLSVHSRQVEKCNLLGGLSSRNGHEVRSWVSGIGGHFPETVCRLDSLRIGPYVWADPIAGLTLHNRGGVASTEIQGNIGTSTLERFLCTFDYAHGTLWLEPGARFADPDHFNRSGLWVTKYEGVVMIVSVVEKSPAAKAGLKVRDVLRAVNGRAVEAWKPEDLEALLEQGENGATVTLTIERDLRAEDVELTLGDSF